MPTGTNANSRSCSTCTSDGNTNPKRLFLDPEIDEGILNEVIPLTIMMNGACTKDMWERIMEVNAEPGEEVEKGVHE